MSISKVTFTTGGTVQAGGGIYLKRSSDGELLEACQKGEFVYVLTSRQMGKSSLMTHAAQQLRSLGIHPVVIDLQAIGTQVTAENWYLGLLIILEEQLMLDTDILDWWKEHDYLGLTQRFTQFFTQVLLKEIAGQIVIFVDEIDTVLSLDFADDFFIAIRYLHQNRAQNRDLHRLSFVLLGVAAPGDLIRNQERTPFNIGQPIDLRGFTLAEIQPLSAGLAQVLKVSENQALDLLEAVLHWTGGQPFLTQKLCQFMVTHESRPGLGEEFPWVSELVHQKIIDRWEAQDTPPHLSTIRDRLARSGEKTARLLGLYQQLLEQGDLPADDRPEQVELRLTGLVVKRDGRLQVFNRIYEAVFNPTWVAQALADLRPYGEAIQEWLSSGRLDESRLLRGQALQEARQWAEGKSLGDDDRRFLDASLEIERREAELKFEAEREANRILTAARDEAEAKLRDAEQRKTEADRAVELANYKLQTINIQVTALASQSAYAKNDTLQALMLSLQAGAQYKTLIKGQPHCHQKDEETQNLCNAYYNLMVALQQALYNPNKRLNLNTLDAQSPVFSVSFSPDGETLASGSSDITGRTGEVRLWKRDGTPITTIDAQSPVFSVSFSPDGETLASASDDGKVKLWKRDGTPITTIDAQSPVWSVSFSPDGETLASGGNDGKVKLWKRDGTLISTIDAQSYVHSVSFSPDGEIIASGSYYGKVKLWKCDGTPIITIDVGQSYVRSVSFSPDGKTIASGSNDGKVRLWQRDSTLITTIDVGQSYVRSVSFSPDRETIAAGTGDGKVKLWQCDGSPITTIDAQSSVTSLSFSPGGETIAAGSDAGKVRLWQRDGSPITTIDVGQSNPVTSVNFSPDGEIIASGSYDSKVKLWQRDGSPITTIDAQSWVLSVSFSLDGKIIASGSYDGKVKLWQRDGTPITTVDASQTQVGSVSFSPDGEIIAAGTGDGKVKLWQRDGTPITTIDTAQSSVLSMSFSPDGEMIASGSEDGKLRLWKRDGTPITTIDTAEGVVLSVSFSLDGETLASGGFGGKVKLRDWNLDRFLAMGCYWTADYRKHQPDSETNQLINATCERPEIKAELPDLLRIQATETAKTGNYAAALKFLQDAQALNPQINLTSQQLQTLASDAVQQQALDRVEFSSLDQLSELFSQPKAITDIFQHVAPLTESRRQQALWLLDRAKSINPNFDLATATQKMQETWQESKNQIVQTFINEGDKKVREQQSDEALQQYRYALQLDPTLPFTPESRVQDKNPGSPP